MLLMFDSVRVLKFCQIESLKIILPHLLFTVLAPSSPLSLLCTSHVYRLL